MTAKWLGVAPWDLVEQPAFWLQWGQVAMNAESAAQAEIQKREQRRARMRQAGGR